MFETSKIVRISVKFVFEQFEKKILFEFGFESFRPIPTDNVSHSWFCKIGCPVSFPSWWITRKISRQRLRGLFPPAESSLSHGRFGSVFVTLQYPSTVVPFFDKSEIRFFYSILFTTRKNENSKILKIPTKVNKIEPKISLFFFSSRRRLYRDNDTASAHRNPDRFIFYFLFFTTLPRPFLWSLSIIYYILCAASTVHRLSVLLSSSHINTNE